MRVERDDFRYTPLFCEENIWWLAHDLIGRGCHPGNLQVLWFSNPAEGVLMLNQRAAAPGRPLAWDYHVVLQAVIGNTSQVFDFDSRLPFPTPFADYLRMSFPQQDLLPSSCRAWVRMVPAADYLAHFFSDRSHMLGRLPASAFPAYPVIRPAEGLAVVTLADYRDMQHQIDDCRVLPVQDLLDAAGGAAAAPPQGHGRPGY
jgi:hypothetical protein